MGRRRQKNTQHFFYDGYLQIANFHSPTSTQNSNYYIWDCTEPVATRPLAWQHGNSLDCYTHDGNKNVSEVVVTDGFLSAHYEYAPFGALTVSCGTSAETNPWRFSSEFAEDDTATVYYNYRHCEPVEGRWTSRDPLKGEHEMIFIGNGPNYKIDFLGLRVWEAWNSCGCKRDDIDGEARKALAIAVQRMNASQARHEWFGSLCCKCENGQYKVFHTGPFEGKRMVRKVRTIAGWAIEEFEYSPQKAGYAACPKGTALVGYYHTHPESGNLSSVDLDLIKWSTVATYMAYDDKTVRRGIPMRTDKAYNPRIQMPGGFPIDPKVDVLEEPLP